MSGQFTLLLRQHEEALVRLWADEVYAERRTDLAALLSYRQLIEPLPDMLDELAYILDGASSTGDVTEAARRLRRHAQVRLQQGCLLDEVARELMILRGVLNDFLWRESLSATAGNLWELRLALGRANAFVDELLVQALVVYAAGLRPPVRTRTTLWPPPRRRVSFSDRDE